MMRALMLSLLLLSGNAANALSPAAYPYLMEFGDALAAHQRGDLVEARVAFRHLAELGDPEARFNLGVMLLKGEGGEVDEAQALAWLRWAAETNLHHAQSALAALTPQLEATTLFGAETALAELKSRHEVRGILPENPRDCSINSCLVEQMQRTAPSYPMKAAREGQVGYAVLHFLVDPRGNVDAVHAMPTLIRSDSFAEPATRAVRRWRAPGCESDNYRHVTQVIIFDLEGRQGYGPQSRAWAADMLQQARAGGGRPAYMVVELATHLPGLFELELGERLELMLQAAVAGVAEARFALAGWLHDVAPEHARRWRLLAAAQGFAPALLSVASGDALPLDRRRDALVGAAREGFLPAVLLAVRELASHPLDDKRDGGLALELTSALPRDVLRNDPSMAEAHAAALAENGQMKEAVEWQRRALRTAERLKRDTATTALRLATYLEGRPWRDASLLVPEDEDGSPVASR